MFIVYKTIQSYCIIKKEKTSAVASTEMNKHVEWKFARITINDNGKTSPKGKCFHNHLSFRLPNFHKCFYNAMETQKLCLIPISFIK